MKTAINNAQIIYGDGRYLKQGSILFDETGILAVGPDPFDADTVIDGRGKTVSPGFIDCHVHLGMPPYPWTYDEWESQSEFETAILAHKQAVAILRSGVTTVRTVGCAFDVDLALSEMERKGLVKTVRVVGAGRVICITAGHGCETGIECDSVGEVLKAARGQVKKGAKALKMMPTSGVIGIGPSTEPQMTEEQIQAFCSVGRASTSYLCPHHELQGHLPASKPASPQWSTVMTWTSSGKAPHRSRHLVRADSCGHEERVGVYSKTMHRVPRSRPRRPKPRSGYRGP